MAVKTPMFMQKREKTVARVIEIPITQIEANPYQPRQEFAQQELCGLALSIKTDGIIQPLTVRQKGDRYELIAGERRLRAAILAGLESVPCIVKEATDRNSALLALVENVQRQDLGFFEEAEAIAKLIELYGMTQEDAALRLGYAQSTLANKLRLLKLGCDERRLIIDKNLSERHARALLKLNDREKRLEAIRKIARERMNVERAERLIESMIEHDRHCEVIRKGSAVFQNLRLFMNTVNKAVETMQIAGVDVEIDKIQREDAVEVKITVPLEKR